MLKHREGVKKQERVLGHREGVKKHDRRGV